MPDRRRSILLVDDDAIVALSTSKILAAENYHTMIVGSGEKAIEMVREKRTGIDVILMDIDLGRGMNGTQTALEIQRISDIPIIFLSAHEEPASLSRISETASYGFVSKNASFDLLNASIRMALRLHDSRGRALAIEHRQRRLFDDIPLGYAFCRMIYERDSPVDFEYLSVNPMFERLTGLKDVMGKKVTEVIPDIRKTSPELFTIYGRVAKTQTTERFDTFFVPLKIWLSLTISSVEPGYFSAIFENISERKVVEFEHRRLIERFDLASKAAKIGLWDWDIENQEILWDARMFEIYGRPAQTPTLEFWLSCLHPDDRDRCEAEVTRAFKAGGAYQAEYRLVLRDGSIRHIRSLGTLFHDDDGRPVRMVGVNLDNTESKESELRRETLEEEARKNNELLRSILESPKGVIIFSLDTEYRYRAFTVSHRETMKRIWGVDIEVGMNMLDAITDPADRARAQHNFDRTLAGEHLIFTEEYGDKRHLRTWWENRYSPMMGENDRIVGLTVFVADITERKRVEESLEASERSYRGLFNTIDDSIYVQDTEGKFLDVNDGAVAMYGYPREYFRGRTPAFLSAPGKNDMDATLEAVKQASAGHPQRMEWWGVRRNGEVFPKDIRIKRGMYFGQDVIITVARDITEQKATEERLTSALRQQDLLMRELQHRVKNNLNIIASLLRLEEPNLQDQRARETFREAILRINSMSRIYQQLYETSRLSSVNLRRYINEMVQSVSATIAGASSSIHFNLALADVELDIRRAIPLGLIINELLTNACKYAFPEGGGGEIKIVVNASKEEVLLTVADDGVGLPAGFDPESTQSMGYRLITMLCKQIGADLRIVRVLGTSISLRLPRTAEQ
jgi:PAS domain S-box-containing protein